ncbi:hypothetical protein IFM89_018497, partial [Coptis chinensis]
MHMEAPESPLMGLFEKRRAFASFSFTLKIYKPQTHEGMDLTRVTTRQLIAKYGLDDNTNGLYWSSLIVARQGGSPYIYPLHGLASFLGLLHGSVAVYGGTYMLNKPEGKVEFDDEGKVRSLVTLPKGKLPDARKLSVILLTCPISHPPSEAIRPQIRHAPLLTVQIHNDVAAKRKFIAFVSTEAEIDHPEVELKQGIDLLGPVDEIFFDVYGCHAESEAALEMRIV